MGLSPRNTIFEAPREVIIEKKLIVIYSQFQKKFNIAFTLIQ